MFMKKKLLAVLLSLAMVSQGVPSAMTFAADALGDETGYAAPTNPEEDDSSYEGILGAADEGDPILGGLEVNGNTGEGGDAAEGENEAASDDSAFSDASGVTGTDGQMSDSDTVTEGQAATENTQSYDFSDGFFHYKVLSGTEVAVVGTVLTEMTDGNSAQDNAKESIDAEDANKSSGTDGADVGKEADDAKETSDEDDASASMKEDIMTQPSEIAIPAEIIYEENAYTVISVEADALSGLAAEKLILPASVKDFGAQVLKNLKTIEVDAENPVLFTENGVLFKKEADESSLYSYVALFSDDASDKEDATKSGDDAADTEDAVESVDEKTDAAFAKEEQYESADTAAKSRTEKITNATLLLYPAASDAEIYVVPKGIAGIAEGAFAYTANLKTLVFLDGIEKIGEGAVKSAANSIEVAFAMEKMPTEIAEKALYLDAADGNVLYFVSEEAYETVAAAQPKFVDSPAMYDTDGNLLEDYSAAVAIVTDGIPERILDIIKAATEDAEIKDESDIDLPKDESISETAKKDESGAIAEDESLAEEANVGLTPEQMDAKIAAGYYSFQSAAVNKYIKIKGAAITDSAIAYLAAHTIDMGTVYNIVPLGGGAYKIIASCSNKALTLSSTPANDVAVVQKAYNGDKNQQWYIRQGSGGVYRIYSVANATFVLDTKGEGTASATPIIIHKLSTSSTQTWKFVSRANPTENKLENGIYKISSALSSGKVLDIYAGSTASGANVQLYSSNGTEAQQFILRSMGYGSLYRIVNVASNKALDTKDRKTADATNVLQATQNTSYASQIWRVVKTSDGKYAILNASADKALDVANGQAVDGANVQIYGWNNTAAQKWTLTKNTSKAAVDVNGKDAEIKAGWYTLSSARTDRKIAVRDSSLADGANVLIQNPGLGERIYFYVEPVGSGKYEIKAFCSNKVLTNVWGADSKDAGNVVQKADSNLSTQRWYIRVSKKNNKYLSIVSTSDPNYVLSLKDNGAAWGTSVTTALSTGLNGQRWKLNAISNPNLSMPYDKATYKVMPTASSSMVLSSEAQSKKSGANVQLMKKVNGGGEFWNFNKVGYGNLYKITNAYTGVALDAKNGGTANGTNVWQYTANDTNAQLWRVMPTDSAKTKFVIMNAASGKALDIYAGSMTAGTNVQLYDQNGTVAQEWTLSRANINTYIPVGTTVTLKQKGNTNRLLEVKDGSTADGAKVQVYGERGNTDQMFVLVKKAAGIYKIRNAASNKYLDIKSTASGAGVISTAEKNTDSQLWNVTPTGDGDATFYITNVKTGYALTSAYKNNTEAITRAYTKANTQKFFLDTPLINTGWQQVGTNWRYYDKNGNAYKDAFIDEGQDNGKYYFDKNGNVFTGWKKYGAFYYYFRGKQGREYTDNRPYLEALFGSIGSKYNSATRPNCPYYFEIDTARCVVTWYTKFPGTGEYNLPVVAFLCSPGTSSTPTDVGQRMTGYTKEWIPLMGPSWGQFGTECKCYTYVAGTTILDWTNNGEYFHSVACGSANTHNLNPNTYNLLGTRQSHGCIRLGVRNAYWIYNFVDAGTRGHCGTNEKSPLRTLPQAWAITNIDPTDPHYTNNWGYVDSYATAYTNGAYIPRG